MGQESALDCSRSVFDLVTLLENEKKLELEMTKEGFWNDRNKALEIISQLKKIQNWTDPIGKLFLKIEDLDAALELLEMEDDIGIRTDAQIRLEEVTNSLDQLEFRQMLSGEHDASDCILTVRSGAG